MEGVGLASAFEEFTEGVTGQPISHLWRGYGSAIFVEIGALTPRVRRNGDPGKPRGEATLGIQWSWRIEDERSIRCGSWSEEEEWEASFAGLRGARVSGLSLFGRLPEVELSTDSGLRLLSFSTTDGQPQWHLADRRGGVSRWWSVRNGGLHLIDETAEVR